MHNVYYLLRPLVVASRAGICEAWGLGCEFLNCGRLIGIRVDVQAPGRFVLIDKIRDHVVQSNLWRNVKARFGHAEFEMAVGCLNGNVQQTVG